MRVKNPKQYVDLAKVSDSDLLEYYLSWEDGMIEGFGGSRRIREKAEYSPQFQALRKDLKNVTFGVNGKSPGFYQLQDYVRKRGLIPEEVKRPPRTLRTELTLEELERLAVYVEEVGESVQIVGKILRFGYDSTHPDGGPTNRQLLEKEIADVKLGIGLLDGSELGKRSGDIDPQVVKNNMVTKRKKLSLYLIHNQLSKLID